uniref:Salivary secreted peptide n=1 Tax=Heliothis virescens TaxID=7102 RepID=A0A2A4JFK1_HELVI
MKSLILIAVLAALALCSDAAVLQNPAFRANMYQGAVRPGDRLLYRNYYYKAPIANAVQYQDITYRGSASTRISFIQAVEVGQTQWGVPSLRAGGVGFSNTTIRLTSARGWGYYYMIEIWGR